jgi:hypothetical protein
MRGLLVRVGVDQAYGHWNGPVDPASGQFVYVTIPEERSLSSGDIVSDYENRSGCRQGRTPSEYWEAGAEHAWLGGGVETT